MPQDLKSAVRELIKHPWFSCVAVLTVALGIGSSTAIFGVVNRLLLNPLPYPNSDRIVQLRIGSPRQTFGYPTADLIARVWREGARSLDGVEAFVVRDLLAYDDRGARVLHGMTITPGLPAFLGVSPVLGRVFSADDAAAGAPAVALLSYQTWQRDYAGARDVLGRAITLDDVSYTVIGVMPAGWDLIADASTSVHGDVWIPLRLDAAATAEPGFRAVEAIGRLRPGVGPEEVGHELDALAKSALETAPTALFDPDFATRVVRPWDTFLSAGMGAALRLLLGAAGLVLLVACSNVASLLLARGTARAQELALRRALGASNWRLVRALLAECFVLAIAAGAVGVGVGWLALRMLAVLRPDSLSALADVHLDLPVLAFALGLSVGTVLLCGLAPALQLASSNVAGALRQGATGITRGPGARARKLFVTAQMAISVVLLVGAGLLTRSVVNLQHIDVGFDPNNLFSVVLSMPRARYQTPASRDLFGEQLIDRTRAIPGVSAVTQAFMDPPHMVTTGGGLEIRGMTLSDADVRSAYGFNYVRPDYFAALRIRVLEGRVFTRDEQRNGAAVLINRAAARRFWHGLSAIGAEVKLQNWATVIGVVDDVATGPLTGARDAPFFYFPFTSEHAPTLIGATPRVLLIVRSAVDPATVMGPIRAAAQALDPEVAIRSMLLTTTALGNSIDRPRFNMALLCAFAAIALVLAAVGLAGVIGYEIGERTHEIGVRVALGARAANVRWFAMWHGLVPAAVGIACGMLGALAAARFTSDLLYGVAPRDPLTFAVVVAVLIVVAVVATWLPARRAMRVDPIVALRAD
jgi:putative ABC transport system permease protein